MHAVSLTFLNQLIVAGVDGRLAEGLIDLSTDRKPVQLLLVSHRKFVS